MKIELTIPNGSSHRTGVFDGEWRGRATVTDTEWTITIKDPVR